MNQFKKIICLGFSGDEPDPLFWKQLNSTCKSKLFIKDMNVPLPKQLRDADCLLVKLGVRIGKEEIDKLPCLAYIGMLGTGFGGIDTVYAKSKGITVTNIPNYATEGVTEFTFAVLLEYLRSVCKAKRQAKNGDYSDISSQEISGKIFGVIGLGNIGLRTAKLAQAFGAKTMYWSRNRNKTAENQGIVYTENVWAKADILTINLALNPKTQNFMNAWRIAKIKKDAVVINLSPMELFDFQALKTRLKKNDMTFILDHSDEMTEEQLSALKSFDNCIIYPPVAYLTKEAGKRERKIYINNLRCYLSGSPANKVS